MQIASRILLVWVIADQFPFTVSTSPAYSTMLLAWSITEVVRYTYFVFMLTGRVPDILQWLRWVNKSEGHFQDALLIGGRYNTFYILYPLGIGSEMWLVYKSITPAGRRNPLFEYILWAILAIYVPGMNPCYLRCERV